MKLFKNLKSNKIQCLLCPHYCVLTDGELGICKVRQNTNNKIVSFAYGKVCAINIDPVEKKPLYHFLPGTKTLSIGTVGCNMSCLNCQNYHISQATTENIAVKEISPEEIVRLALKHNCESISYTYNEPTVFFEFMLDTAKLATKEGIKNILVSNGYINKNPLLQLIPYLNAANIDLKAFDEDIYKKVFNASLNPVLETIKTLYNKEVHIELTNLIIPTYNDNEKMIQNMCNWLSENCNKDLPIHYSRFYPTYKLDNLYPTPLKTIEDIVKITRKNGFAYVYQGNTGKDNKTTCIKCGELLIDRSGFKVTYINITNSECNKCGYLIYGVWNAL